MLVAILGLGVLFGMISGVVAVIAGQTFLTALALYVCIGMVTSLTTAIAILAFDRLQDRKVTAQGYFQ
ncbi:MAG: hypothetical protein RLN85_04240 [Pseudomonadales bacterium]